MLCRIGSISLNFRPGDGLAEEDDRPLRGDKPQDRKSERGLADPDSPTMPSVSPLRTATSTPSTALMWPTTLRSTPRLIGNQTLRSLASITSGSFGRSGAGSGFGSAASSALV